MRKKIVAGNWKMNLQLGEVTKYLMEIDSQVSDMEENNVELILFMPSIYFDMGINFLEEDIKVGSQDCSAHDNGAYTGEISASMLANMSAGTDALTHCLVGHSERRKYHNETNELLAQKVDQLIKNKIAPIFCCGETLEERDADQHKFIIKTQLEEGLFHLSAQDFESIVIAYEPVWAIGTGVTATSEQAQEMHSYIRALVKDKYSSKVAEELSILYGGSCKPTNAKELFEQKDIDGGLIGGASLQVDSFLEIAKSF